MAISTHIDIVVPRQIKCISLSGTPKTQCELVTATTTTGTGSGWSSLVVVGAGGTGVAAGAGGEGREEVGTGSGRAGEDAGHPHGALTTGCWLLGCHPLVSVHYN